QQMLGVPAQTGAGEHTLTSNEIFGDLLDERSPSLSATRRPMKPTDDVDKLLADTLGGVMPQKKKEAPAAPPAPPKPKTDFDKALQAPPPGLEKNARKTVAGATPVPPSQPAPAPPKPSTITPSPPSSPFNTEKITLASPILAATPAPSPVDDEEPADGIRFGQ